MQLILDTPGIKLSRANALFEVSHPPEKTRIAPEQIDNILIAKGVVITSDAILLALKHHIEIVFIDYSGSPKGRIWNNKFGSIAQIRRQQIFFSQSPEGLQWVKNKLLQKINEQLAFLYQVRYASWTAQVGKIDQALKQMEQVREKVQQNPPKDSLNLSATMRGWEGTAAKHYFQALAEAVPEAYKFDTRNRRPAKDIFNCMLNYLYGMLYAYVEGALIKAGVDPAIGIWHTDEYNKPVLAYDFIEPYRVWADAIAFRLCQQYALSWADTTPHEEGIWLAGSGKKIIIQAFQNYLEEIVPQGDRRRTRLSHIQLDAHEFAQMLLKYKEKNK